MDQPDIMERIHDDLVTTAFTLDGYRIVQPLGLVRGIVVRSREAERAFAKSDRLLQEEICLSNFSGFQLCVPMTFRGSPLRILNLRMNCVPARWQVFHIVDSLAVRYRNDRPGGTHDGDFEPGNRPSQDSVV